MGAFRTIIRTSSFMQSPRARSNGSKRFFSAHDLQAQRERVFRNAYLLYVFTACDGNEVAQERER